MAIKKELTPEEIVKPGDTLIYRTEEDTLYDNCNGKVINNVMLIPLDGEVFFPFMQIGSTMSHPDTVSAIRKAYKDKIPVLLFNASDTLPNKLKETDISDVFNSLGVIGYITGIDENPDGSIFYNAVLSWGGRIKNLLRRSPYLRGDIELRVPERILVCEDEIKIGKDLEQEYENLFTYLTETDRNQLKKLLSDLTDGSIRKLYFMIQNSPLDPEQRYEILKYHTISELRKKFLQFLKKESFAMQIKAEIHHKTMAEMGNKQREEILRAQLRHIKAELGEGDDSDEEELRTRAGEKAWSEETEIHFNKELRKLMRYNPSSPDYAIQYSYLDNFLNLPWLYCDNSTFELKNVEEILDRDHYGLEKVKERIIEQMAVLKHRNDMKAPILCLYGPPGVGKTSLGKSVAEALGRKYVRVALGGVHDESEIRGHRRTYIGSMPGRIISALEKCGTSDPVMVLDEIDKIGSDYKGDPAHALLEVLDPEQNFKFHDNYIDFDYDLSKILFIATANSLQNISAPLLDRMELIEIGGYVEAEKLCIAQKHLIPKSLKEHGFHDNEMQFNDDAILEIIKSYTRESGVRQLEKQINSIMRKQARLKVTQQQMPQVIDINLVKKYLGRPTNFNDEYENNEIPGIVTGLAWTQNGGEILFIESSIAPGKEGKLTLTGNLGDVMKESAMIALQYIKANGSTLGIDEDTFEYGTVHIHVPEGAVPKDGPSAGITILTSLASSFSGRKVRSHLAMTGEMTLRGKVLPVGGIKEKILAAKRAGIKTIMLCSKNRKDVEEIKKEYLEGLEFYYVDNVGEVLEFALI